MTVPKKQHWVPRFYLKYFCIPGSKKGKEKAWFMPKSGGVPQAKSIKEIAVINHLYTKIDTAGVKDAYLEEKLSRYESSMAKLWERITSELFDYSMDGIRKGLALFAALQLLRNPEQYSQTIKIHRRIEELYQQAELETGGSMVGKVIQFGQEIMPICKESWEKYKAEDPIDLKDVWLHSIRADAVYIANILNDKRWTILVSDDPIFITSDYPVYVPLPKLKKFQIGADDAIVLFPISPNRVLMMDNIDGPNNKYCKIRSSDAHTINMLTLANAESFVVSPRNIHDVMREINIAYDNSKI